MSEHDVALQLQRAHHQLKQCHNNATKLRIQWLESVARYKAGVEGDEEARKNLAQMVRRLHEKQLHRKCNLIIRGPQSSADYVEIPTADWYYWPSADELYHYDNGVFEAHPANQDMQIHFHPHHN